MECASAVAEHVPETESKAAAPLDKSRSSSSEAAADIPFVQHTLQLRSAVSYLPHPDKVHYGGEDAHFVSDYGGGAMGVADGVGGWQESGVNPAEYSRSLMRIAQTYLESSKAATTPDAPAPTGIRVNPRGALEAAHSQTKVPGSATACVMQLDQVSSSLVAANLGDSGFAVYRQRSLLVKSRPLQHYFDCPLQFGAFPEYVEATDTAEMADLYSIALQPGDVIVSGTDGLWDNVYESEILQLLPSTPEAVPKAAESIASLARRHACDDEFPSPYTKEALSQGLDLPWYEKLMGATFKNGRVAFKQLTGGKQDDITVIVSLVEIQKPAVDFAPAAADPPSSPTAQGLSSITFTAAQLTAQPTTPTALPVAATATTPTATTNGARSSAASADSPTPVEAGERGSVNSIGSVIMNLDLFTTPAAVPVYLVQGLTELADLANEYLMKDALGASPAEVAGYQSASNIPWMLKPVIGFVTDSVPLFGYKRRSYLLIASVTGAATWLATSMFVNSKGSFLAMMLINSTAGAFSDVVADTIVVDMARGETQATSGSLQSLCWSAYAVGEIATAYFSGSLVQGHGPRFVIGITAIFPMLVAVAACRVTDSKGDIAVRDATAGQHQRLPLALSGDLSGDELEDDSLSVEAEANEVAGTRQSPASHHPPHSTGSARSSTEPRRPTPLPSQRAPAPHHTHATARRRHPQPGEPAVLESLRSHVGLLRRAVLRPAILWPTAYMFLLSATPSAPSAMFYFQTVELGFTPKFLGEVQLVAAVSSLVGVGLYERCFKRVPLRRMMAWGTLLLLTLQANQLLLATRYNLRLGLSDALVTLGGGAATDVVLSVLGMPVLVLAARMCPVGIEGTMFAMLMSVTNLASGVSTATGAALTSLLGITADSFDRLPLLLLICNLLTLLPLPLLLLIPHEYDSDPDADRQHASPLSTHHTHTTHDAPASSSARDPHHRRGQFGGAGANVLLGGPAQVQPDGFGSDEAEDTRPLLQRQGRKDGTSGEAVEARGSWQTGDVAPNACVSLSMQELQRS
ncbi:MAG: hypothetical protein WDW36_000198 [Sanguina aurantia]